MASHLFLGEALADLLVEVVRRVGLMHEGERLRSRQRGALSLAVERRLAPHVEIGMLGSRGGIPGSQGGKEPRDGPGKRFPGSPRPIAMTTLAAILALLPLALGLGQGSAMQQPLAIAIISGLVVQMPLVLIVMPLLVELLGRVTPRGPSRGRRS